MKKIGIFFGMTLLSLCLGSVSAFGCGLIIASGGGGASFNCIITGSDANFCYYDCTCSGTDAACDRLYDINGLY